jgi:hypothetical protein
MSADKHRAIRRAKQKRAKQLKKGLGQPQRRPADTAHGAKQEAAEKQPA